MSVGPSLDRRHKHWEERLIAWLQEAQARPHVYGSHDCMVGTVAGFVLAVTGVDLGADHRGRYSTEAGGARYLKGLGFDNPEAQLAALFPERPILRARRGDLVLRADGIPGGCIGAKAAFIGMEDEREGLVTLPTRDCVKAWSVGEP